MGNSKGSIRNPTRIQIKTDSAGRVSCLVDGKHFNFAEATLKILNGQIALFQAEIAVPEVEINCDGSAILEDSTTGTRYHFFNPEEYVLVKKSRKTEPESILTDKIDRTRRRREAPL